MGNIPVKDVTEGSQRIINIFGRYLFGAANNTTASFPGINGLLYKINYWEPGFIQVFKSPFLSLLQVYQNMDYLGMFPAKGAVFKFVHQFFYRGLIALAADKIINNSFSGG